MHMSDALINPAVGGAMWTATAATTAWCSKRVAREMDERKVPLMGVLGAFIFAAQMVNFSVPGTGSSGHLGGGMILAVLLGPHAAFLVMASVLTVQALFFADGGLLALGANIFNLGVFPCFVAYPLIFRPLAGKTTARRRLAAASLAAAVAALQLGSLGVVLETVLSGISELPFRSFLFVMQPIHLGIGIVEGLVTAAVVGFVWKAQPGLLTQDGADGPGGRLSLKKVLAGLAVTALVTGGAFSWFASADPDGLEWSIGRVAGTEEIEGSVDGVHGVLGNLQERTSLLPDYGFRSSGEEESEPSWPAVDPGTSVSGIVGGLLTLFLALGVGWLLRRKGERAA